MSTGIYRTPWNYHTRREIVKPSAPTAVVAATGPLFAPKPVHHSAFIEPWDYHSRARQLLYPITIEGPRKAQPLIHPYWAQRQQLSMGRGSLYEPIFDYTQASLRRLVMPITITGPPVVVVAVGEDPAVGFKRTNPAGPGGTTLGW